MRPVKSKAKSKEKLASLAPIVRAPSWRERLVWSWRRQRWLVQALVVGSLVLGIGLAIWQLSGVVSREASGIAARTFENATLATGFTLDSVVVTGRTRTDPAQILAAIGVAKGGPILNVDPQQVRERLEALDWIDHANVRRILPGRIEIEIHESVPFAVWQQDGHFSLIDARGHRITSNNVSAFAHLPLVVGAGAADKAAELFALLETQPALKNRVQAAVRVGDRRWNICFENNVELMLPETGYAEAWAKFANIEADQRLLARAISHVDMRLKDKLVVRLTDEGLKTMRVPGRAT
jgi:cell division protein FtsQ